MTTEALKTEPQLAALQPSISAIVPARNEELTIAACVESLAKQPEITEILVVNDQSTDKTAEIVRGLMPKIANLRLLETTEVPPGWVGKSNAVFTGSKEARSHWLLFTDADAELEEGAAARALDTARDKDAALVSFSPEQITKSWYEKALIPFLYLRLAKLYPYDKVNNPESQLAAANGQFLLIRRDAYDAIGGHAAVAADVLEDVALAVLVKRAGFRQWFGSGKGIVRVRMYRSFRAMWQGWKKNLYILVGGTPSSVLRELEAAIPWIPVLLLVVGIKFPILTFLGVLFLLMREFIYGSELSRNQFSSSLIIYYIPAVMLYAGVLWASYRGHMKGKIEWKGRELPAALPGTPTGKR